MTLADLTDEELLDDIHSLKEALRAYQREASLREGRKSFAVVEARKAANRTNGCKPGCRHECGECRLGLGVHRECDPRCEVADRTIGHKEEA